MLEKLVKHPVLRYVLVGGIAYLVDVVVLIGLYDWAHTSRALAASASFWCGLIISFVLQKFVAFQDFRKEVRAISRQIVGYACLVAFNYILTVAIVSYFPGRMIIVSRTIAVALTTLWNFVIYRKIIFHTAKDDDTQRE